MAAPSFGESLVQRTIRAPSLLAGVTHQPSKKFVVKLGLLRKNLVKALLRFVIIAAKFIAHSSLLAYMKLGQ